VKKIVGIPWRRDHRRHRWITERQRYESEGERLARTVKVLGEAFMEDQASWDLGIAPAERARAYEFLRGFQSSGGFFCCSIGTKCDVNKWDIVKWRELLKRVGRDFAGLGLLLLGSKEDQPLSDHVAAEFDGRVLNLCGVTTPRESAALLEAARIFVGHDSGPMHLAAAVGTRCVAIFSARNLPHIWFPSGDGHRVIYHAVPCGGCGLENCIKFQKKCIGSVTVNEVYAAVSAALNESGHEPLRYFGCIASER
jgi:ADP-heptose:LPS heptosyltransferase